MLGSYLKAASGPRPVEYVGSVTKTANSSSGWDTPAEALDVLGVASEGDLVVIAFSFEDGDDSSWSWVGMSFTPIFDGTGVKDPGYYVGYKVVESGDSNPYVSGVGVGKWERNNTRWVFSKNRNFWWQLAKPTVAHCFG
jgi:DMSO/TMAO reductase YedYZ molybdopterin-dependent catalytic subunit